MSNQPTQAQYHRQIETRFELSDYATLADYLSDKQGTSQTTLRRLVGTSHNPFAQALIVHQWDDDLDYQDPNESDIYSRYLEA